MNTNSIPWVQHSVFGNNGGIAQNFVETVQEQRKIHMRNSTNKTVVEVESPGHRNRKWSDACSNESSTSDQELYVRPMVSFSSIGYWPCGLAL